MLNKVILIGHLGRDPEDRIGDRPLSFSMATTKRWKDKASGDRRERTSWHRIVIFEPGLIDVAEKYLRKGSKAYIEGAMETREFTGKDGIKRTVTEVVLQGFGGKLVLLDRASDERAPSATGDDGYGAEPDYDGA